MKLSSGLKLFVLFRALKTDINRIATALESLAQIERERREAEIDALKPRATKKMTFGTLDIAEAEKEWKRRSEGRPRDNEAT